RKILLTLVLAMLAGSMFAAAFAGKPMMYADSYMLRAQGSEANYWNPALINEKYADLWLPGLNSGYYVANNSLDLEIYNHIMSKKYLDDSDKQKLLDMIDGKLSVTVGGQSSIFGITFGNVALTSSFHYHAKASVSEKYLELLLYGNTEEHYTFNEDHNHVASLSYVDLSLGYGDIPLPLPESVPPIKAGIGVSLLVGIEDIHTANYAGSFSSTIDGLSVHQDLTLKTGAGGFGFKAMLGLVSEPLPNLHAGITLDNIFGFIKWGLVRENLNYSFNADSVYVANLQDDIYEWETSRVKADPFSTALPPELRIAALYRMPQISLSADYVQGFGTSIITSKTGRIAFGMEYQLIPIMPIHLGLGLGNADYPWRVSYGVGLKIRPFEFGVGMQSFESVLPGVKTKGVAFASYFRFGL
ncbi:MAG: DUF5723 family protein, partial [Candidatus Cloacimonadaceae bacterium]|nr:DUF5723 family protein [Candidatus Cloacimonadaceae bacterium]